MINPFRYLTIWSLLFIILEELFTIQFVNTHLVSLIVSVFGLYITYVIKKLIITDELVFSGKVLMLLDVVFHQLPMLYLWFNTPFRFDRNQTLITFAVLSVYMLTVDIMDVYRFKEKRDVMYMICLVALIYILLSKRRLS